MMPVASCSKVGNNLTVYAKVPHLFIFVIGCKPKKFGLQLLNTFPDECDALCGGRENCDGKTKNNVKTNFW